MNHMEYIKDLPTEPIWRWKICSAPENEETKKINRSVHWTWFGIKPKSKWLRSWACYRCCRRQHRHHGTVVAIVVISFWFFSDFDFVKLRNKYRKLSRIWRPYGIGALFLFLYSFIVFLISHARRLVLSNEYKY